MDPTLAAFMQQIITLGAGLSGMGGAQAGIAGSRSTETDVVNELRRNAHAFADAYTQKHQKRATIKKCAEHLAGSLQSMYMISAISENTLHQLSDDLQNLAATPK